MAGESSNAAVTSEQIRRAAVNSRRNSTGPSSSSSLAANYLRASTGSCHDVCKFGMAHSFELKARNTLRRKHITRPPEDEILVKSTVFPKKKKNSPVNRPKASPSSQIPVPEANEALEQKVLMSDRQNSVSSDLIVEKKKNKKKKSPVAMTKPSPSSSTLSLNDKKLAKKDPVSTSETSKRSLPTNGSLKKLSNETTKRGSSRSNDRRLSGSAHGPVKSSSLSFRQLSSSGSSFLRLQKRGETKPPESTGIHKIIVTKNLSVPSSASPPSRPSISKKTTVKTVQGKILGKRITFNGASPRKGKDKDVGAATVNNKKESTGRTLHVVDAEENESKTSQPVTSESIDESMNVKETESKPLEVISSEGFVESNIGNVQATESKALEPVAGEGIVESNFIVESNIVNVKETESKPLELVTRESIAESISPPLPISIAESLSLSPPDSLPQSLQEEDQSEAEYTVTESEDSSASDYESDIMHGGEISHEGNGKTQHRKVGHCLPESEEVPKPRKLRFRRGRIIDVQHESNTPRRLRFRRGRLLGETQNLNPPQRSSLKRSKQIESDESGPREGSAKVFLRHNDVQEKKDSKVLFNNVIEETASKLAETRKSKVKALVGAFETVISLQDTKPSANT